MINDLITVVVPVFRMSALRERNFWYVMDHLLQSNISILVAEQKIPDISRVIEAKVEELNCDHVSYCSISVDDNTIHKSRLINHAVKQCKTPYVWVNDADCMMDFANVLETIVLDHDFIRPFRTGIDLYQQETQDMITSRASLFYVQEKNRRNVHIYGALSFIFKKSAYELIGGMNESYKGWGLEDFELRHRILTKKHKIKVMRQLACHMWHPRPKNNQYNWSLPASLEMNFVRRMLWNNRKVIHVVNLMNPTLIYDDDLRDRVSLALKSIQQANRHRVVLLGCTHDKTTSIDDWSIHGLKRTRGDRNLAYLKDLFDAALHISSPEDHILYTNLDCIVTDDIYQHVLKQPSPVVEYHRRDVTKSDNLTDIFSQSGTILKTGIDGFAIKAQTLKQVIDKIPDFVIGEPHWDITLSEILSTKCKKIYKNSSNLYHIRHARNWSLDEPSEEGSDNTNLACEVLGGAFTEKIQVHKKPLPILPDLEPEPTPEPEPEPTPEPEPEPTPEPEPEVTVESLPEQPQYTYTTELCVMVICCYDEITTRKLQNMLAKFFSGVVSKNKKFDLFICVDNVRSKDRVVDSVKKYTQYCKNLNDVTIINNDILDKNNTFTYNARQFRLERQQDPTCMELGSTSGANFLFYDSIEKIMAMDRPRYSNILLLEWDTQPTRELWFDPMFNICDRDFIIAGSKYKGVNQEHQDRFYRDHLNGVAIYKNNNIMKDILRDSKLQIKNYIESNETNETWLNFDVAMYMSARKLEKTNMLINTTEISNYSDPACSELTIEHVLNRHPDTVILHKKDDQ